MNPIPIPSHQYYEQLLRLLEQQTLPAVESQDYSNRNRTQEVIITIRKALSLQRQLEADWQQRGLPLREQSPS